MMVVNNTFEEIEDSSYSKKPLVFFGFEAANFDNFNHVRSIGETGLGFEDLLNGKDGDFDDIVLEISGLT